MAGRWRIRHKLMLGLGLVVAIMTLLLTGTLKGLLSYRATRHIMSSKLDELTEANKFREAVKHLGDAPENVRTEAIDLQHKIGLARQALARYQEKLQETVAEGWDSHQGELEQVWVQALQEQLVTLEKVLQLASLTPRVLDHTIPLVKLTQPPVKGTLEQLTTTANDLCQVINNNLDNCMRTARKDYHLSIGLVLVTSVAGMLLMAGLLRFFYCWVFYPIRDLQQGAGRIAQGDFKHRIVISSGDEMEDLAGAFNHMTDQLAQVYDDLAQQVDQRSRQLVRSERLASVGFLAAGVAHEINNPLASIAFASEALQARLSNPLGRGFDQELVTKYLKMIQDEAFRCKKITERLLEFSRGGERQRQPHDLGEIIQSAIDLVQPLPLSRGKQIVYEPAGRLVAWVNEQDIKSVVVNLVVNALQSMDEGGTLTITQCQQDGRAELVFSDTGCGMTAEVLENIFEPFYTRSRTGKGTGLGLSISHQILTQHGGEIGATSAGPNQGSTFVVRLPIKAADVQEEPGGVEQAATPVELFAQLRRKAA